MNKFSIKSTYIAALPRSYKRRGGGSAASPISGSSVTSGVSQAYVDENFVDLASEQDIFGIKNFVNGLKLSNKLIRYDADKNVFIFPGNILAEGGVAWNTKLEGFEEQTITAAVQVDWKTIGKNDNGELYVIGGTGGGSGDSSGSGGVVGGVTIDEVKSYLTNEGYATQVWVNEQGFLKSITSSMVTSALSYTPFNAANFTKTDIKNTLGISDWALESVKPSYKFSEIDEKPTTLSGYGITDAYTKTQIDTALAKKWTQDDSLIANWNSAYSWGNHASAGYAKQSDITSEFSKYVTLSTTQTVTGIKNFSNGLKVGGILVSYNADKNAFVLPANLLVEGGVAWNSKIDGFDVPTIMDAIIVDDSTISKTNGYLEFVGQTGGGGVADSVAWENVAGRPTKLSQFTNDSGFITSASLPNKLSDLTDDVVKGNYLPINDIAVGAKTLKASATSSSWTVAAGNGINVYNSSSTQRYWFGFSLTEGSPYATTKWVFGASDSSYNAGGEIYAKHISLGYGDNTTTGDYALRANGDAKIDGSLTLNGKVISYNASKNAFVFPANAIFEGGVAWNASIDGFTPQTIMDAIIVDDDTISKANGYLEFIGETGGLDETELAEYLTNNNYAKKSDIPSLSGYATQSWVTNKGYITSSAIPTKVSAFDNDSGYITGITSAMVTSALGYTPYNSASFTKANIKSTLGISDWALATASPLANHGKITSTTDLTTLTTGIGYTQGFTPVDGAYNYGQLLNFSTYRGLTQIYISDGGAIYLRNDWNKTGIADRAWRTILTSSNYSNYALSLSTDQDVTGIKNFVNGVKVGGSKAITYDATKNAFIFPANILAEGGVAWNTKIEGFDQQTVTAAVSVDETTISRTTSGALQLNPTIAARIAALEARVEQLHPTDS